jgi:hypothetical protein
MIVTDAKYTRRVNTGDFEFKEMTLSAQVEQGETGAEALISLEAEIASALSGQATTAAAPEVKKETTKQAAQKPAKKGKTNGKHNDDTDNENTDDEDPASEDAGSDDESDSDDETTDTEASDDSDDSTEEDSSDEKTDGSSDDNEEETKPAKGKSSPSKTGKKTFKKKPQSYNRGIEQHKEIFSSTLRSVMPDWKKSQVTKDRAKKVSEQLEGESFLDENGEVLPEFTAQVKKLMSAKK